MNWLLMGEIIDFIESLRKEGKTEEEIRNMVVFLGDDEELNGIHLGYTISKQEKTDDDYESNKFHYTKEMEDAGIVIIS